MLVRQELGPSKPKTNLKSAIPRSRAECHTVCADAQATHAVFVSSQYTDALSLQRVPDIAGPVIITAKKDAARDRESDRCDTAQDVIMRVSVQLAVGTDVKQPAGSVVRASGEGITVGEESTQSTIM